MTEDGESPVVPTAAAPKKAAAKETLEEKTKSAKPGFKDGFKLGIAYFADPLGRVLTNWENVAVDGKNIHDGYSQTLFEKLSADAHKGNSFAKYVGEGTGVLGGAIVVSAATVPYGVVAAGSFVYDMVKTFGKDEKKMEEPAYKPSFWEGFKGGFGIAIDPVGFAGENLERNIVNGKGIDENWVRSVAGNASKDARKGNSVSKYIGGVLGIGAGAAVDTITVGVLPVGTAIYDFFASVCQKKKPEEKKD